MRLATAVATATRKSLPIQRSLRDALEPLFCGRLYLIHEFAGRFVPLPSGLLPHRPGREQAALAHGPFRAPSPSGFLTASTPSVSSNEQPQKKFARRERRAAIGVYRASDDREGGCTPSVKGLRRKPGPFSFGFRPTPRPSYFGGRSPSSHRAALSDLNGSGGGLHAWH
jgi:hypothetical protein